LDKCIIERKSSLSGNEIEITSYVHRPTPKGRAPSKSQKFVYSNPKEKQLHEGFIKGWIPFSIIKTIGTAIS
jgi:hypothetical protein